MNKTFILAGLGLALAIIGQLMNSFTLTTVGIIIAVTITVTAAFYAWVLNGLCSRNKKTIFKGWHRPWLQIPFCLPRFVYTKNTYFVQSIIFTQSCITNHQHINKLFGFTVGTLFEKSIHKDSFRFGFATDNGVLGIYAYYYVNGIRSYEKMVSVDLDKTYRLSICRNENNVDFKVYDGNRRAHISVLYESNKKYGYKTGLYYGGEDKAPHTIKLKMW